MLLTICIHYYYIKRNFKRKILVNTDSTFGINEVTRCFYDWQPPSPPIGVKFVNKFIIHEYIGHFWYIKKIAFILLLKAFSALGNVLGWFVFVQQMIFVNYFLYCYY